MPMLFTLSFLYLIVFTKSLSAVLITSITEAFSIVIESICFVF